MEANDHPEGDYQTLLGKYMCAKANAEMFKRNNDILRSELEPMKRMKDIDERNRKAEYRAMSDSVWLMIDALRKMAESMNYDSLRSMLDDYDV